MIPGHESGGHVNCHPFILICRGYPCWSMQSACRRSRTHVDVGVSVAGKLLPVP